MGFYFYTFCATTLILGTAIYLLREYWLPFLDDLDIPGRDYIYSRLPSSFTDDIEAGLTSDTFDLHGNIDAGDGRAGLDDAAKTEILRIMKRRRLKFDAARQVYMENKFKASGIAPDGRPRDPKFVSFS